MQFIRKEIVLEEASDTFLNLLRHIVHRQEINVEEIVQGIDKKNLYAEISGKGKTNFFSIGFLKITSEMTRRTSWRSVHKLKSRIKLKKIR